MLWVLAGNPTIGNYADRLIFRPLFAPHASVHVAAFINSFTASDPRRRHWFIFVFYKWLMPAGITFLLNSILLFS